MTKNVVGYVMLWALFCFFYGAMEAALGRTGALTVIGIVAVIVSWILIAVWLIV